MTKRPAPLGTVNGYIASRFTYKGKRHLFDGTMLDLTLKALDLGVKPGERVNDVYGPGGSDRIMCADGGGDRTPGGVWMDRPRDASGRVID